MKHSDDRKTYYICVKQAVGFATVEASLFSLREIDTYIELIDLFYDRLSKTEPGSAGLKNFKKLVFEAHEDTDFINLRENSSKMTEKISNIKSITLGINIDTSQMTAKEAGVVSVNSEYFRAGDIVNRL